MTEFAPANVLTKNSPTLGDIVATVYPHPWDEDGVLRYKTEQVWHHPSAILPFYFGGGVRFTAMRVVCGVVCMMPVLLLALAVSSRFTANSLVQSLLMVLCMCAFGLYMCITDWNTAWRWESTSISLDPSTGVYQAASGHRIPESAQTGMRQINVFDKDITYDLEIFKFDPVLRAARKGETPCPVMIWDDDGNPVLPYDERKVLPPD